MSRAIAALRESAGGGTTDAWPAGAVRTGRDYDRYLVICRSGTTTEVIEAMRAIPSRAARTVICSSPDTPVLELGDSILIDEVDERSVVQTRFATTALAILRSHLGEDLAPVIVPPRTQDGCLLTSTVARPGTVSTWPGSRGLTATPPMRRSTAVMVAEWW